MTIYKNKSSILPLALVALFLGFAASTAWAKSFDIARIYFEYNFSANDLGVHVFLDGEDWEAMEIVNPQGSTIFEVEGRGPYASLGLTELFFEGAEPNLDDVPLAVLLAKFPAGNYRFVGETIDEKRISALAKLSHGIPNGPSNVNAILNGNTLVISWAPPVGSLTGLPFEIVAYQVIVGNFQVTVPADVLSVTVTPEFVDSLGRGEHDFEVLAIAVSGNQSITEASFEK